MSLSTTPYEGKAKRVAPCPAVENASPRSLPADRFHGPSGALRADSPIAVGLIQELPHV